ncbi:uncharacterized protein LOC134875841 isoform X2 [Eleginops maclovinus]|uniref:uncharacterized protein LOC134875841 isoform X2 n=1 Tax=Eleginops maclovinus TaxID=56733 RepID=UPI00308076CF
MCQSRDVLFLSCLFLTVLSQDGHTLLPQNVSLRWIHDFQQQLIWAPPQHSMEKCKYEGYAKLKNTENDKEKSDMTSPWQLDFVMEGGFLEMSVKSVCGDKTSEPVVRNVTYPELVRDLQCYVTSSTQTHCIWKNTIHTPSDMGFFYHLTTAFKKNDSSPPTYDIRECPSYNITGDLRTGCDLKADVQNNMLIAFNGTLNKKPVRNTFRVVLIADVRPPALQWTVTKKRDSFQISWTKPNISMSWEYTIRYTECTETKTLQVKDNATSTTLPIVSHCPYKIAIQAKSLGGETPWTDDKDFAADTDPNAWVYAAVIIPLLIAFLAGLAILCCRENWKILFPKIPIPRDLISGISNNNNNNNKSMGPPLYVPAEKEDNFNITLVTDPQISKPDI